MSMRGRQRSLLPFLNHFSLSLLPTRGCPHPAHNFSKAHCTMYITHHTLYSLLLYSVQMTSLIGLSGELSVFVSVYIHMCICIYTELYCGARGRFFPVATSAAPPFLNLGDPLCRAVKPALSPFRHSRHHCFDYQFHCMSCCSSNRAIGQCWCWESGGNLVFWERQTFVNLCRLAFWPQEPQNGKHTTQDLEKATNT